MNATHWANLAERGSALGLRITEACYRLLGEKAARVMLGPVVLYVLLTAGVARRSSFDYFQRLGKFADEGARIPTPGWTTSYRHMLAFAAAALDKVGGWMKRVDARSIDFPNQSLLEDLLQRKRGALLVSAHVGNVEILRALAVAQGLATVNAIVYTQHAARFKRVLERANADFGVNLLEVDELGPDTGMMLGERIDRGEILVIVGDRTPVAENGRTCTVPFLGSPARFSQGPYILAATLRCPIYTFFCLKDGPRYRVHFELLAERVSLPRRQRDEALQRYAREFARRVEAICVHYPYQWFNFYDYWQGASAPEQRTSTD